MSADHPFVYQPLQNRSWVGRITGVHPKGNAVTAISNLLARARSIEEVSADQVLEAATANGIQDLSRFEHELRELFEQHLRHCLSDHILTSEEVSTLAHLRRILGLSDVVLVGVFSRAAAMVVADGKISQQERDWLREVQARLSLSDAEAHRELQAAAQRVYQNFLDSIIADGQLSPIEDSELERLAQGLGAQIVLDQRTQEHLQTFRLLWAIENAQLPAVDVDINLQRAEIAHWYGNAVRFEHRKTIRRIGYAGPALNIRLMRGVYWRAASYKPAVSVTESLDPVESGRLYLTNKRLFDVGERRTTSIRLQGILGFVPYTDGMEVQKSSGKNQIWGRIERAAILHRILARVVQESGDG